MQANVCLQEIDFNEVEFGDLDRDQAIAAFRSVDWAARVIALDDMVKQTDDCCPPNFLITFGRSCYLSITVQSDRIIMLISKPTNGPARTKNFEKSYSATSLEEIPAIIGQAFDDFNLLFDSIK